MGEKTRPGKRDGRIVIVRVDERWAAQLELDERDGEQASRLRVDVPGTFLTQPMAARAAERVLDDWRAGRVTLRELVLQELAAVYRRLREKHNPMEPVIVPTTKKAWERAIALWGLAAWLESAEAARYGEHARVAFEATTVTRHPLRDLDPDPAQ